MPWGMSHEYKFIFIHIPKTAGTTICSLWGDSLLKKVCQDTGILGGSHQSAMQLKELYPTEWDAYYKFSVIRNPFDRFVSKYFFRDLKPKDDDDFNIIWDDTESEGMLPQLYWVTDRHDYWLPKKKKRSDRADLHFGNIIVDKLCRYESLEEDLRAVFKHVGLEIDDEVFPHFRQTRAPGTYQRYFTPEFKNLVEYIYREDFERFKYAWHNRDRSLG